MKILCPINGSEDIDVLADNGADEFYFGFYSPRLANVSRANMLWNRRPYPNANVSIESDAPFEILRAAQGRNRPVYTLANELFYSTSQATKLKKHILSLAEAGLTGLVASDLSMITWCSKNVPGLKLVASTTANVFNSGTAEFLQDLGVSRIILPIRTYVNEIAEIHQAVPDMEIECFTFMEGCINVNGLCLYCHLKEMLPAGNVPCRLPAEETEISGVDNATAIKIAKNIARWSEINYFSSDCMVCGLPELSAAGVGYLKISGRDMTLEERLISLKFLRAAADAAGMVKARMQNGPVLKYRRAARLLHEKYIGSCMSVCAFFPK